MNGEQIRGTWNQIAGAVREKYGQITKDDILSADGNLQRLIGTIQEKTGESREVIEKYVESARQNAGAYVNRVYDSASDYASTAANELRDQYGRLSSSVADGVESAKEVVHRRPMESVLTAFGVGIAAGLLAAFALSNNRR